MTSDPTDGLTLTYDPEHRISGTGGYTYTYDADVNRVKKTNGTTGTIYWYMTLGIVAESDLSGALKSEYVFFDGERVARRDLPAGSVAYYFSDHLKTASVITDSLGNIKCGFGSRQQSSWRFMLHWSCLFLGQRSGILRF